MSHHDLKTDPEVFFHTWVRRKNFEIRINDRDFKAGDTLTLKETVYSRDAMIEGKPLEYTGRECDRNVLYVLHATGEYGIKEGWAIMAVSPM